MNILFLAPYSPAGSSVPALGAARKIDLVVQALSRRGDQILFVNTANNVGRGRGFQREMFFPSGAINSFALPCFAPRFLGRFIYIFLLPFYCLILAARYKPEAVWIYNFGAGELLGGYIASLGEVGVVVEVEDMPRARRRGLGEIKPLLDSVVSSFVPHAFGRFMFVSNAVARHCAEYAGDSYVFQGLVAKVNIEAPRGPFRVGYCGGLSAEKGADILFELANTRDRQWPLSICGSGEWADRLSRVMRPELGDRLTLSASDVQVAQEIASCSILLNPHIELQSLGCGVFPFKVIEYINSGARILSSDVGIPPNWVAELGISVLPRSTSAFLRAIDSVVAEGELPLNETHLSKRRELVSHYTADVAVEKILPHGDFLVSVV